MKQIITLSVATALFCMSCGNNHDETPYDNSTDSAGKQLPLSNNNDATNPSIGDTTYYMDTIHKDSSMK